MWRMLLRKITSFKRDDRGLQLVELAIAVPVLILLFAAVNRSQRVVRRL